MYVAVFLTVPLGTVSVTPFVWLGASSSVTWRVPNPKDHWFDPVSASADAISCASAPNTIAPADAVGAPATWAKNKFEYVNSAPFSVCAVSSAPVVKSPSCLTVRDHDWRSEPRESLIETQ